MSFTTDKLKSLYGSKASYLAALRKRVDELVKQRFILTADGEKLVNEAKSLPLEFE